MLKVKQASYKVISFMVAWMVMLSGIIPTLSIIANAGGTEPIVTQTQSQTIENFRVSFVSGADNVGTEADPSYVWTPSAPDKGHRFKYQIDYDLSGEGELAANTVHITVPKHILRDRNGEFADICELAIPEETEVPEEDTENTFVFIERDNDFLIYNRIEISAAEKGSIQFAYDTSKTTFEYIDMGASDTGVTSMRINKNTTERLYTESEMIPVKIDTMAKVLTSEQRYDSFYQSWQSSWGDAATFGIDNPNEYYYVVWRIKNRVNATQPYILTQNDNVTGTYDDVSVVGVKINAVDRNSVFSPNLESGAMTINTGTSSEKEPIYSYMITKHLKSTYLPAETYKITNVVTSVIHPIDNIDSNSSSVSSALFTYSQPKPSFPIGHFNFWKYNSTENYYNSDVANYQLEEFANNEIEDIHRNIFFRLNVVGYAYPWTIEDNYSLSDIEHYGKKPVTYVITDDEFFFYDTVNANNIPEGTEQLDCNDYEITKLKYNLKFNSAKWNTKSLKFESISPVFKDDDAVYFYAKFGTSESWSEIGVYHLKSGQKEIKSDEVISWDDNFFVFGDDSKCVGYKIVSSNAFYYTGIDVYPYCKIKHSERIDRLITESYDLGEARVWLTNRANTKIYANGFAPVSEDNLIFDKNEYARDYITGFEKHVGFEKKSTFQSNNKIKQHVTLGWKVEFSESYMTQDGKVFVSQSSGTFYDLLPLGCDIDIDTVDVAVKVKKLRGLEESFLKRSRYDVSTIPNYKNSGRTLLIVKIKEKTDNYYILTYSTIHAWDNIIDYGSSAYNSVAYKTGNDSIAGGYPDNGGRIKDCSIMSNLDDSTDDKLFVYTEKSHVIDVLVAVSSGLIKKVKSSDDLQYSKKTVVYQNELYAYKIRYATDFITQAKNIVLFDSIENYTDFDKGILPQWAGTLQSVDISQPEGLGADPVIYLSDSSVDLEQTVNRDLSDTSIWKPLDEFGDLSNAKSIAIDFSKDTYGNEFVLDRDSSITVVFYMKSPVNEPNVLLDNNQVAPQTYNDIYMDGTMINVLTDEEFSGNILNWKYDTVEFRIRADIPILKLNSSDNITPVDGVTFRLRGQSDYGTDVDISVESDINGYITFRNIEKGIYTLTETIGSIDYQSINESIEVQVNSDGSVTIDNHILSDNTRYVIADDPRVHTDIVFTKKDIKYKYKTISGVKFRLYGTSDYQNYINMYATSDENGVVSFNDVEMGNYVLEEVSAVEGYIRHIDPYNVRVDDNGNYTISGCYVELDGTFTVYNEPLHSLTIQKESYTKTGNVFNPIAGAVFRFYGISNQGKEFDITKTTQSNGKVTFYNLEAGSAYIIEEISAPDGYVKDNVRHVVKITEDGTITITGIEKNSMGEFVFKNKEDGNITVTKQWVDNENNDTRGSEPKIHIGVANNTPVAYFGYNTSGSGSNLQYTSILSNVTALNNIKKFVPYTGEESMVQALVADGTAKKIDDGKTNKNIYAWYISDLSASDYGTLYWWSDAVTVYLTNKSSKIWKNLTQSTYIDVSGIDISKVKDMSGMFYSCRSLTSFEGIDRWDVSSVTNMSYMFSSCSNLTSLEGIDRWDVSSVTNMDSMFSSCRSLISIEGLDRWDVSSVTNMRYMLYSCSKLTSIEGLDSWDVSSVTNMDSMFNSCRSLTSIDLSGWNTSSVTDMSSIFQLCSNLTSLDLSGWNTSSVTNMSYMFSSCSSLTSIDLSGWDVSSVTNMDSMFSICVSLTSLDLSGWDVSSVTDMGSMFFACRSLTSIEGFDRWDVSSVTNMGSMFSSCSSLTSIDLSGWNTSSVTNMSCMFRFCSNLKTIYVSNKWNTLNVTNSGNMFNDCTQIRGGNGTTYNSRYQDKIYARIDIQGTPGYLTQKTAPSIQYNNCAYFGYKTSGSGSNLQYTSILSNITDLNNIKKFVHYRGEESDVQALIVDGTAKKIDDGKTGNNIYAWYISNSSSSDYGTLYWWSDATIVYLTNKSCHIWYNLSQIIYIDTSGIDISPVTDMSYMFSSCSSLTSIDLSGWNVSSVTNMSSIFRFCSNLTSIEGLDSWDVSSITDMSYMFSSCSNLTSIDLSEWDVSSVTNMSYMFSSCRSLTSIDLSGWDVSSVINMRYMFDSCSKLTSIEGLDRWDVSSVTDMSYMFRLCNSLTSPDLSGWDVSSVITMGYMFYSCSSLISLDLSGWDVSSVIDMRYMFSLCSKLTSLDISEWDVSSVTSMYKMFYYCSELTSFDLSGWNTSSVTNMDSMFSSCSNLKTIYVSNKWNTSNVTNSDGMFNGCTQIRGGNGTTYNSSYWDKTYARIDTEETPGYLTFKEAPLPNSSNIKELYNSTNTCCFLTKVSDKIWNYVFTELDPTLQYYVWEDNMDDYTSLNMGINNALEVEDNKATITNTIKQNPPVIVSPTYGSLNINETIISKHNGVPVNNADMLKTFLFTVTLHDSNGDIPEDTVFDVQKTQGGITSDSSIVMRNGVIQFRLGHTDDITIFDIPADYTYSVVQTVEDGFDMEVTEGTDTGSIIADTTTIVGITNQKDYDETEDDITFTVEKVVKGNVIDPIEKFQFAISLSGLRANGIYEVTSNKNDSIFVTASSAGVVFMEPELVNGEVLTFTVPKDTEYTVLEKAGAYTSSYQITDNAGLNLIAKSADYNSEENKDLSTQVETADAGEEIHIVFTNLKQVKQNLTITKELVNAAAGNTDLFDFTLIISGLQARTKISSSLGRFMAEDDGTITVDFSLSDGDTVEVYDIPVGAYYEVIESESSYIASYKIYDGEDVIYNDSNNVPNKTLTTGVKLITAGQDPDVVFSNRKVACDVTVTKMLNITGETPITEYRNHEFNFDIEVHGLEGANRKYSEFIVEYTDINTTGAVKKTLAEVLGLSKDEAEQIATDAVLTVTLHHGESIKFKDLPTNATFDATEQANMAYAFSYIVKANEGAVLQTEARSNTDGNKDLSLNDTEVVDLSDTDIEFVFTGIPVFIPYFLPEAGFADQRLVMLMFMIGIMACACLYWYASRKLRR